MASQKSVLLISLLASAVFFAPAISAQDNSTSTQLPSTNSSEEDSSETVTPSEPPSNSTLPGNSTSPPPHGNSTHPPPPPPPHGNCTCPPPPPPTPPPRPPHPLHNLTDGHRIEGDSLVLVQNVTVPGSWGATVFAVKTFNATNGTLPLNITQVQVTNLDPRPYASIVKKLQGGPGHKNVTLMFKSLKGGIGISFIVKLFAL